MDRGVDLQYELGFDLILASASPRRRELLERLGLTLKIAPVDLDETPRDAERAGDYVRRVAAAKCDAAVAALPDDPRPLTVLGADTIVDVDGEILGKPRDADHARSMLARLAGRRHDVTTAYRIWRRAGAGSPGGGAAAGGAARIIDRAVTTAVSLRLLRPAEIEAYVSNGEWQGKAGGYAVQGIAAAFVTELRGSHSNVIGLPLAEVIGDLMAAGALVEYPRAAFGGTSGA
jgi:septum formation protein